MKVKDTKRKVNKIDLNISADQLLYELEDSTDQLFLIKPDNSQKAKQKLEKDIVIKFLKPNISSQIDVRVVIEEPINVVVNLLIIAEKGIKGVESTMDMRALLLNESASIKFVPSLEIDEMNVSVDHKSSIGTLTPIWLGYFYSRGLDKSESENLLKEAFLRL